MFYSFISSWVEPSINQAIMLSIKVSVVSFCILRMAHSHMISTLQPDWLSLSDWFASLVLFPSIFAFQKSVRVFGSLKYRQLCPCQKQPWIKMAARYFGRIRSGLPGRSLTCMRKRRPRACRAFLMIISGAVFLPLILDIMRDRVSASIISTKINPTQDAAHPERSRVTPVD